LSINGSTDAQARGLRAAVTTLIGQLRHRYADTSHASMAQRFAGTAFLIRVLSAALVYGSQILLARWMGTYEFGVYVFVWTVAVLIGDLCDLGLASSAQRFVPEYRQRGALNLLRGFVLYSRWLAIASACIVAIAGVAMILLLQPWLSDHLVLPLMIACVMLPFYVLMQVQDGIARSYDWVMLALMPLYIVRHAAMLALVLVAYLAGFPADAITATAAVGIAIALTAISQSIALNRRLRQEIKTGPKERDLRVWYATALPIFVVEGLYLWVNNTDILVLQFFRSPEDVAIYFAAAKTLTLVSFVYFAVAGAVAHRFSEYHAEGDQARLIEFLRSAIKLTFWPSLVATIAMVVAGQPLLMLFGKGFMEGYPVILILSVGLLARASVGPAERLLLMVGQQRACAAVYGAAFVVSLALCLLLVPRFGIHGAAAASASALIVESALLFAVIRRRLGLHAFIWGKRRPA